MPAGVSTMRSRSLALLVLLSLAPVAPAHAPAGTPDPACSPAQNPHDYLAASGLVLTGFSVVMDGCAAVRTDREEEFGMGVAFLPADHHGDAVCVVDETLGGDVAFVVGADGNGDGLITSNAPDALTPVVRGCVTAGFAPGWDGGWWVFVHAPATAGHVYA